MHHYVPQLVANFVRLPHDAGQNKAAQCVWKQPIQSPLDVPAIFFSLEMSQVTQK